MGGRRSDAPYDLTPEWTRKLITEHHIDYTVHGDDPCITVRRARPARERGECD